MRRVFSLIPSWLAPYLKHVPPWPILIIGLAIAGAGLVAFEYGRRAAVKASVPLVARSAENLRAVSSIWFSPTGRLLATDETEAGVRVLSFSEMNGQLAMSASPRVTLPAEGRRKWSVAVDGSEIALLRSMEGRRNEPSLVVRDVWRGRETTTGMSPLDFAYARTGKLVLLQKDELGIRCEVYDRPWEMTGREMGMFPRVDPAPYVPMVNEKQLLFSTSSFFYGGSCLLVETAPKLRLDFARLPSRHIPQAFGPGGLIAAVGGDNQVTVGRIVNRRFEQTRPPQPLPRAFGAMAFYNDTLLLATPTQIIAMPGGDVPARTNFGEVADVRLLATAPPQWAYLTNDGGLAIARHNVAGARLAASWQKGGGWATQFGAGFVLIALLAWWSQGVATRNETPAAAATTQPRGARAEFPAELPPELITAITERRAVLVAGQRIGVAARLPDMPQLLGMFIDEAQKKTELTEQEANALRDALARGRTDLVADDLCSKVSSATLNDVGNGFRDDPRLKQGIRNPLHEALASLPFAAVVHAAVETGLRAAMASDLESIGFGAADSLISALGRQRRPFVELYGESSSGYILGPNALRRAMFDTRRFRSALQSLLTGHAVVFVGLSPAEVRSFSEILDLRSVSNSRRFIIAEVGSADVEVDLLRHEPQTTLVGVEFREDAKALVAIGTRLAEAVHRGTASPASVARNAEMRVQRIVLQNIGPFPLLELDLERDWNLFLGNNGRGKSIALRAIAAGLCGEKLDATTARRLLSSDADSGSIEITVGGEPYLLKFERHRGEVTVRGGLSPVELGRLLAIGFPPVRTVSWTRSAGPSNVRSAPLPSVSDVSPLATSAPDPRLDDLKQWLINLDYRATGTTDDARAAKRLFNDFFRLLDAVTPDVDLAFYDIDKNTYDIRVKTTGGAIVPLESLSQGTTSVIGWVGVLLQRMYEVFGSTEKPEEETALVLVDEVDAHMHPSWQQTIVRTLSDLFKNAQFIVTTHSPLIVTSLDKRQVFMFKKRDAGILVEQPDFDVRGLRPDQLLTTPLFDLETVRDPEVHERLMKYTALAARDDLSATERRELQEHADFLGMNLPLPQARAEARQAFELIESSLNEKIEQMPEDVKLRVLNEVKVQLQEITSDSRRPE